MFIQKNYTFYHNTINYNIVINYAFSQNFFSFVCVWEFLYRNAKNIYVLYPEFYIFFLAMLKYEVRNRVLLIFILCIESNIL